MKRLDAVCSLIVPAKTIADVGCDHGLVAEFCANSGMFERVIASDISEECLNKARGALANRSNVDFYCCDGIKYECDEAVIAGMGGANICDILDNVAVLPETLVLCPHRDADAVRRKVTALGYSIDVDEICEDRGIYYFVMRAVKCANSRQLSELQYMFGVSFCEQGATMRRYLIKQYNTYNVAPKQNERRLMLIKAALDARGEQITNNGE